MTKKDMVKLVVDVMQATSITVNLEKKRHPTPEEIAVEIVEFFYRLAKEDTDADIQNAK